MLMLPARLWRDRPACHAAWPTSVLHTTLEAVCSVLQFWTCMPACRASAECTSSPHAVHLPCLGAPGPPALRICLQGFRSVYKPQRLGSVQFAELLDAVAQVDPEMRIRFTSPHPKDFSDDVLRVSPAQHGPGVFEYGTGCLRGLEASREIQIYMSPE